MGHEIETDATKLRRRNEQLQILNAIARALNEGVDINDALETTLAKVAGLLGLETGWIWLRREDSGAYYLAAAQNLPPALAEVPHRMAGSCYCLDAFRAGDLGAANISVITCSRLKHLTDGTKGLRCHASVPLEAHGKPLGVLNVAGRDWQELSDDTLCLLRTIGGLLSIAIERARLFEESARIGAVEERNRLAREIHDTLAQGLTGIVLQLESADALLEGSEGDEGSPEVERARHAVRKALKLTRHNMEEARRSVLDLRAAPLEGRTLAEALDRMASAVAQRHGLDARAESVGGQQPLPVRIEAGLYRIAQEATNNVLRHADATQLLIHLVVTPAAVELTVEDNGRGFEMKEVPRGRYGMVGLNERAKLLGGQMKLCSVPGDGTVLSVHVPLERRE